MADHTDNSWPTLGDGYSDEFGEIEPEVYAAAQSIWPEARAFVAATLGDTAAGRTLLTKAAASVSRVYAARRKELDNLNAYLFQTYKRLILAELKKIRLHNSLNEEARLAAGNSTATPGEDLETKILIEQLMWAMDEWTREVFELRVLGYSFDELGPRYGMLGASVRNKFNSRLKPLIERFGHSDPRPGGGDHGPA